MLIVHAGLPFAMQEAGLPLGIILLLLVAVLTGAIAVWMERANGFRASAAVTPRGA